MLFLLAQSPRIEQITVVQRLSGPPLDDSDDEDDEELDDDRANIVAEYLEDLYRRSPSAEPGDA